MKFQLLATVALVSPACSAPTSNYVVHERRDIGSSNWATSDLELHSRMVLPISIGLTQRNLERGEDYLMDVSDPSSPNYSNHWTREQVCTEGLASMLPC